MKRMVSLLLVLTLCLCWMASMTGANADEAHPNWISEEKITLTCMIPQSSSIEDLTTNYFTKWLEEQTNVHLDMQIVPSSEQAAKLGVTLASGDYPDIFIGMQINSTHESIYGTQEGLLLPLNDLIDKYCVNIKKAFEEYPFVKSAATSLDGNLYSIPTLSTLRHTQVPQRCYINTKWLANLGLEMPTTTEEFLNVLRAFRDQDANGNGDPNDEIPCMGETQGWHGQVDGWITGAFCYYDSNEQYSSAPPRHLYLVDGKITSMITQDAYRDALRYMNQLWDEGLIYEGSYTQSNDQATALMENPDGTIVGVAFDGNLNNIATIGSDNYYEYMPLSPIAGPDGTRYAYYNPYGIARLGYYAVASSCKNPEVAIKLADFLYSFEASLVERQGEEGVDWRYAKDGELGFYGQPAIYARMSTWAGTQNKHWDNSGLWYETAELRAGTYIDNALDSHDPLALQRFWEECGDTCWPYVPELSTILPPVRFTEDETSEFTLLSTALDNACVDWKVGFITGQYDVDTQWDEYISELKTIGLDRWIELHQIAYDRYIALQN